ncbi:MAG: putative toxin-antitoxin system toxin component, PIN family [Candidatus Altiarchaeales archaeon]|nr:putative toxin-antitoxin system toxin component, PIN family [Candidatus Altiarchaeales archaeon]
MNVIKEDSEDNRVIECALESKADYIISGDRHLLTMRRYKGIKILNAKRFLGI